MYDEQFTPQIGAINQSRNIEFFHHNALASWGGKEQQDSFAVLHPKDEYKNTKTGLYVVFHSAGHDLYSTLGCTFHKGNHDIYRTPDDLFGLYVDCRAHEEEDFWWGGINAKNEGKAERKNTIQAVEKRIFSTIEWVINNYNIDVNRVYAVGNSMGGSGALGLGMCRGDLFAAIKVNVPAGVEHFIDRCFNSNLEICDPPICIDYSAKNDTWSNGHEKLYKAARENRFALYGYWANFGHANVDSVMLEQNDLIHSFDWLKIRKNQAYPVMTNCDADKPNPWENPQFSDDPGFVNAFFNWENKLDTQETFEIILKKATKEELKTSFDVPENITGDISLRRLQFFKIKPNEKISWSFGKNSGVAIADSKGLLTIEKLTITSLGETLKLSRIN
jgi:dienelactone hydrolase